MIGRDWQEYVGACILLAGVIAFILLGLAAGVDRLLWH